ncbi:hypothetical protein TE101_11515 [Alteromonas macleodii]|nr:hypothetical protein TE101_11515 [Alteromonas macleodii]
MLPNHAVFKVHLGCILRRIQKIAFILFNADQEVESLEQQLAYLKQVKKSVSAVTFDRKA